MSTAPSRLRFFMNVRSRQEWQFFAILGRADGFLALAWWGLVGARGILPAVFAVSTGALIGAVQHGSSLTAPLVAVGIIFILLQVLGPWHTAVSSNLGDRVGAWLYDRLTEYCVQPPGLGHLEDPQLSNDLSMARDFDLGITAPPLSVSMDFIATGLVQAVSGFALAVVLAGLAWWAPILLGGAWLSTHWLLRESGVWRDRNTPEVRAAQRDADYTYRLAVDPPAAKELRLFGLGSWTLDRFLARRTRLFQLQYQATRLREQSLLWTLLIVIVANLIVLWFIAAQAYSGHLSLAEVVVYAQAAVGTSAIAFGAFNWALDGSAAPVAAVLRLGNAMPALGAIESGKSTAATMPNQEIRLRDVCFAYTPSMPLVLNNFNLTIPAGSSVAIVGQNGAGKTTLAKLLCHLYDPSSGSIEVDGIDLRRLDVNSWRGQVTAVFQDYTRFELPLSQNVAPSGAPKDMITDSLISAGAEHLADLDTILSRSYAGGTDLSGGQWQRVALARALCAVRLGAKLVILDEPTAQLDVRGEAEIFDRILTATRDCTTILISHRFSTVRRADIICVLEHGRVTELGSHDELMDLAGRYRTMFELQAAHFDAVDTDEEGVAYDTLA